MNNNEIAYALNVIGGLLALDPADPLLGPVLGDLRRPDFSARWAAGEEQAVAPISRALVASMDAQLRMSKASSGAERSGSAPAHNRLHEAFRDLFIGPAPLCAPPWGSVYLDEERVLFGNSTSLLKSFLARHEISVAGPDNGPEDHFGTVCWVGAWLASEDRMAAFDELMAEHVLPWGFAYLEALRNAATALAAHNHAAMFYAAVAELATLTLRTIQARRDISAADKRLYV